MAITVNESYITHPTNRSNRKRAYTKHLVLHETVSKADARRQLAFFNGGNRGANCHAFIDWNEVLVTLPLDEIGWHVGPVANPFTEGVELCRASTAAQFAIQWRMAVEWFAYRCEVYGRGADMILSHHEIAKKYGGTDHTDPDEYFAMYGKTVDDFRADVAAELNKRKAIPAPSLNAAVALEAIYQMQMLTREKKFESVVAYNFAANASRRAAHLEVTQTLGVPTRDEAQRVVDILSEMWHQTSNAEMQAAYHIMADALREATSIPK